MSANYTKHFISLAWPDLFFSAGRYRLQYMHPLRIAVTRYYVLVINKILQVLPGYHGTGFNVSAWWILPKQFKYNWKYTRKLKSIARGPGSRLSCFRYALSVPIMSTVPYNYTRYTPWLISSINVDPLSACMHDA